MFLERWPLQVIPILYILSQVVMRALSCPKGQIGHKLDMNETRCCKPWPYTCPPGYPYTICGKDGEWDRCEKCQSPLIHPNPSNSNSTRLACFVQEKGVCQSEDKVPLSVSTDGRLTCVCDRSNDYVRHFTGCDLVTKPCGIGRERQLDGSCSPCENGTFKNWEGPGLCIPITNCEILGGKVISASTQEKDNVCGNDYRTTAPKPTAPKPTATKESETSSLPEPGPVTRPSKKEPPNLSWLYILVMVPVTVVVILVILCIKRRNISCNICQLSQLKCTDICARCFHQRSNERRDGVGMQTGNAEHIYVEINQILPGPQSPVEGHQPMETSFNGPISEDPQPTESTPEDHHSSNRPADTGADGGLEPHNEPNRSVAVVKPMIVEPDPAAFVLHPVGDGDEYSQVAHDLPQTDHLMLYPLSSPGMEDSLGDQSIPNDIHNLPPMSIGNLSRDVLAALRPAPNTAT